MRIHKAAIEKAAQPIIGFLNAVDGGAAVVVLVPFGREVQGLMVFLTQKILA